MGIYHTPLLCAALLERRQSKHGIPYLQVAEQSGRVAVLGCTHPPNEFRRRPASATTLVGLFLSNAVLELGFMPTLLPNPLAYQPQHFVFEDASWAFYEQTLCEIGDRAIRVTYCDGRMEIMSPLPTHEYAKRRLGRMIEMLSFELNMPTVSLSSTTFRREDLAKGLEPDECYYFKNAAKLRADGQLDLTIDPPPDLALEIDITSKSIPKQPIYAALGVPELWRFDGVKLHCLHLINSHYESRDRSLAFPFLNPADLVQFLTMHSPNDELPILRAFMAWVRNNNWLS